jgi:two-component system OmpR family sensor kinase
MTMTTMTTMIRTTTMTMMTMTDPHQARSTSWWRLGQWSVRSRITVAVAALTSSALGVVGLALYAAESQRLDRTIDYALAQEIGEFRTLSSETDPRTGQPYDSPSRLLRVFLERNLPDDNETLLGFGPTGGPSYQGDADASLRNAPALLAAVDSLRADGGVTTITVAKDSYKIAVLPIAQEGAGTPSAFVVAHNVTAARSGLNELMGTYALLAALSVLLISGCASWVAGRLLSPVRRLRDTARSITAGAGTPGTSGARLVVTGNDDLSDLQHTFNEMLDRIDAAFAAQRDLLDDAAHELRTPLTVLSGHLEVLNTDDVDDVEATRELLLDEIDRMSRLVNDLLLLAKSNRPDFVQPDLVDVEDLTHGVLARASALADRDWHVGACAQGFVMADQQRLTQAMLQLCENAARFTEPGQRIDIGSSLGIDSLDLWVADSGPGVDPAVADHIFERFTQGNNSTTGSGLGLSIVSAIASAHGGQVLVSDAESALGGATFHIHIPRGSAP